MRHWDINEAFLGERQYGPGCGTKSRDATGGRDYLRKYSGFRSINGTAESTTLSSHSVDFVTAGQAFHWFDRAKAKIEFLRILKPGGWIILIWNERRTMSTPFLRAYEQLLRRYSVDYQQVDQRKIDQDVLKSFYGAEGSFTEPSPSASVRIYRSQGKTSVFFLHSGGRYPNHRVMLDELASNLQTHQINGQVEFEYLTKLYYGRLDHWSAQGLKASRMPHTRSARPSLRLSFLPKAQSFSFWASISSAAIEPLMDHSVLVTPVGFSSGLMKTLSSFFGPLFGKVQRSYQI